MERQRSVSVSPAQTALLSLGRKWSSFSSLSLPKSISRLSSPSRNSCAHGLLHILLRSQALGEKAAKAPQPLCHDLGPADRPTIFSLFPQPRGERERVEGHVPSGVSGIGMSLVQKSSVQLLHHPHSACESLHCELSSTAHVEQALLFLDTRAGKT